MTYLQHNLCRRNPENAVKQKCDGCILIGRTFKTRRSLEVIYAPQNYLCLAHRNLPQGT